MARRQHDLSCELSVLETAAAVGTWCWQPDGNIARWSDGLQRIWGLAADPSPTLSTLLAACHPLDRNSLEEACHAARESGASFALRHRVVVDGRDERQVMTYGQCKDGVVHGLSQDISQSVSTEVQLREAAAINEAIVRHAGMGIISADLDSRAVTAANPAACRMLGYSEAEMIGMAVVDLAYHEDANAKSELSNKITKDNAGPHTREKRYRRKDGSIMWGRLTVTRADSVDDTPLASVALIEDIEEERRQLKKLQVQEAEMRAVFEGAYSSILLISDDGIIRSVNPTAVDTFNYQPEEIVGQHVSMLFNEMYAEQVTSQLGGERVTAEIVARRKDGSELPVTFSTTVIENEADNYHIAFMRDQSEIKAREIELMADRDRIEAQASELAALTETSHANAAQLEVANQELTRLATTDSLTGILNRRMVMDRGAAEFERLQRYGNAVSVVAMDIDHFKKVNDTYGHGGGDAALRAVADACQSCVRVVDTFGRMGGEEFLAILPETTAAGAEIVAEKIRSAVEALTIQHGGDTIRLTISIGVSEMTGSGLEAALDRADQALYAAKNNGRNRVVVEAPDAAETGRQKQA